MIRIERSSQNGSRGRHVRVRIIGALNGPLLNMLDDPAGDEPIVLDLSDVREVEVEAVHRLAQLPPDRYAIAACPNWLALWIEHERRSRREGMTS